MNNIEVIVISMDLELKKQLIDELKRHGFPILAESPSVFNSMKPLAQEGSIILILDTENIAITPAALQRQIERHKLHVILLGTKNLNDYRNMGLSVYVSKPPVDGPFARKVFCRNVVGRVEFFNRIRTFKLPGSERPSQAINDKDKIIAIAASTGGPEALNTIMKNLPNNTPPILIVQHMPSMLTYQFAARMDKSSKITVKEASMQEYLQKNLALVAPGDFHMRMIKRNSRLLVECFQAAKMHGVRPAADILFDSMAELVGANTIGVILTGMGSDGARGLQRLKQKGAITIGQNEASSVVYGMPKVAFDIGAVDYQLPIDRIADKIMQLV
ncbi:MAG: CheB methylesterase domain-containing protein [Defluviitaleaceae bacterium]|nr:CheB methylesterase domain-containing protein [Defluviitaleaceae bacterium]